MLENKIRTQAEIENYLADLKKWIAEEDLCRERCRRARVRSGLPEDMFIHIDTPLTMEHQLELMKSAGFRDVKVLHQNGGTVLFRAEKHIL